MKTLVLTDRADAAAMRGLAPEATVVTDPRSLATVDGEFDAAVVDGLLERERWDRWLLQRIHGLLRTDAQISVSVPHLTSVAAALDVRFLAYLCRKLCARALRPWLPPRAVGTYRRYHIPSLARTMQSVGFTGIEARASWFAPRTTVKARKERRLTGGAAGGRPDARLHGRWYSEQYAAMRSAREAWLSRFPDYRAAAPLELEPSAWRDARVLVLAPHPDDELIGCGGTLCRLAAAGAEVTILQATDGAGLPSLEDLPEARRRSVRLEEAERVAAALGARLLLWRERDQGLRCSDETVRRLAVVLEELRPTHVFTPFLGDVHPDHSTLSYILGDALAAGEVEPRVLQYEVWSLAPANLYCDVGACAQRLEALLVLYEQAMRVDDFVHACQARNGARALELTGEPGHVEAFLATTAVEYRRLAAGTRGDPWQPKISVVMPVFNAERYVAEAIESVLRQTYGNFELIVVDDASTDRSREMVARFADPRVRMLVNDVNRGVAYSLNRGLSVATGELIARMDADDISLPERFARQVQEFARDPDLALCCTNGVSIAEDGSALTAPWYRGAENIAWSVLFYCPVPHASVMLRAARLSGLAYPQTRAQDIGLWREMLGRGNFRRVPEVLIKYRVHPANVSRRNLPEHQRAALESARKTFARLVGEHHAARLLVLTQHHAESGAPLPRFALAELEQAGKALVGAYRRAFAPRQDAGELMTDFRLRLFWHCFRRRGRFAARGAVERCIAAADEWVRTLGASSLCAAAGRFFWQRLR